MGQQTHAGSRPNLRGLGLTHGSQGDLTMGHLRPFISCRKKEEEKIMNILVFLSIVVRS
jgi:hypothetical protein